MLTAEAKALVYRNGRELVRIEAWGKDGIRVRCTLGAAIPNHDWALLPEHAETEVTAAAEGIRGTLRSGKLECRVDGSTLGFYTADGRCLFSEQWRGGFRAQTPQFSPMVYPAREYQLRGGNFFRVQYRLDAYPDEKIFGMGQYQDGLLDKKGSILSLSQRNSQASVPFYISSRGYGFLWNNPAVGTVTFGTNRTQWEADSTDCLDYWVTAEDTPAEILKNYERVSGMPTMMPDYAMGFWQCKLRYRSQEEVLSVAREYHRRGIPVDVIIIDFFHWTKQGEWKFDPRYFPDPEGMVKELREMGMEPMVSVWPTVQDDSENYAEMEERGLLLGTKRGLNISNLCLGHNQFFDATNPESRAYVWGKCREHYFDKGIRLYWLDVAEPEYAVTDYDAYTYHMGPGESVANIYPQQYAKCFYEGLRADGVEHPISLIRCAWAGSQRYGALAWSGDIGVTFEVMRTQLAAGLSMAVSGIPWWNTDIGGFEGGQQEDPAYREVLIRWFEWGTFCPVMRLHGCRKNGPMDIPEGECGSGGPNEIWSYGEEACEILKAHIEKRNELRPYIRSVMTACHEEGETVMAPLFMRFPEDRAAWEVEDEYMFGPKYLVAPVMEAGKRQREVYFPAGERWKEIHTGKVYAGGRTATVPAPLNYIPVFERI